LATIAERRGKLWTIYAYTPASAVVVYGGAKGPITSRWVFHPQFVSAPALDAQARVVSFDGRQARIAHLKGRASIEQAMLPATTRRSAATAATSRASAPARRAPELDRYSFLQVIADAPISAFAFSGAGFGFGEDVATADRVTFSDASGRYVLSLKDVLDAQGNLKRDAPCRLTVNP
jgi:hypothetical protein